jgi:crotonobetainyl-CoA:carnitine CoA-transferase CaiB-like acyl-CoA transferase
MCLTDKFWTALLGVIGRPELARDPRFATAKARHENREPLTAELDREFRKQPTSHWLEVLGGVLPIAPVYELDQALEAPFVKDRMVSHLSHPARRDLRILSNPIKINGQRLSQKVCPPAGADTDAVLQGQTTVVEG